MDKQIITIVVIIAVVFFGLGFFVGQLWKSVDGQDAFQSGWDAAEQRLIDSGLAPITTEDMEITSISGQIVAINGNNISVKITPLEPLADPELDNRVIKVDSNTKFYRFAEKDATQYQIELEEYDRKIQEESEDVEIGLLILPDIFAKTPISLSDIQEGQYISAIAQKDIKDVKEFNVVEVVVQ